MENSPLILAHNHARNALHETRRSNPVAASEEHDLAAAEFATAAQGTSDTEALRILNLLEQHHKRLGQILKTRHEAPHENHSTPSEAPKPQPSSLHDASAAASSSLVQVSPASPPETTLQPPRLPRASRNPGRDLSSSLASNLATARGIPGAHQRRGAPVSPTLSAQHVGGNFSRESTGPKGSDEAKGASRKPGQGIMNADPNFPKPSWTPPSLGKESEDAQTEQKAEQGITDAPFQQFYSTFEALISKLSAPLAFAGLPLNTASTPAGPTISAAQAPANSKTKPLKPTDPPLPVSADSVDYSRIFSKAALRAVRDGAPSFNPAESFYVVPTEGGMLSYADIITRTERENSRHSRQRSDVSEGNDEFVDAREAIPVSTDANRSSANIGKKGNRPGTGGGRDVPRIGTKTMEELALENHTLKLVLDQTAKRLRVFELSAQSSSAALAQSIRSLHRSPAGTPENSRGKTPADNNHSSSGPGGLRKNDEKARARIAELEEILKRNDAELQRRERENAKLKLTVNRYREKWEKLKEGARARREGGAGVGEGKAGPSEDTTTQAIDDPVGD